MTSFKKSLSMLVAAVVISTAMASAQDSGAGQPAATAQVSTGSATASPAKTLFGDSFGGRWSYSAELGANQEFNDNIFSTNTFRSSDTLSRFSARFSASMQNRNFRFEAHYFPNYVLYNRYSDRNTLTHQYDQRASYRFSGRTELTSSVSAMLSPSSSNSPFQFVNFGGTFLPVFHPEALQTNARIFSSHADFMLSHRLSARNTLIFDLQGGVVKFKGENGLTLASGVSQNTFNTGASIQWNDEIVPGKTIGLQLGDSYFGFLSPASHSHFQYLKARYSQKITNTIHFSFGAGPSRREDQSRGAIPSASHPSFALDAELTSKSPGHSIGISYNHGSQSGLTQGSLSSDGLSVSASRHWRRRWDANTGFSYSRSNTVNLAQQTTTSYAVNGGLSYTLSPSITCTAGYSYLNQASTQVSPIVQDYYRNIFTIGLRYSFRVAGSK